MTHKCNAGVEVALLYRDENGGETLRFSGGKTEKERKSGNENGICKTKMEILCGNRTKFSGGVGVEMEFSVSVNTELYVLNFNIWLFCSPTNT